TMGASLKRLVDKGYVTIALSRNMFSNNADRYSNNALKTGPKLFSLASDEAENKMRLDVNKFVGAGSTVMDFLDNMCVIMPLFITSLGKKLPMAPAMCWNRN